MAYDHRHCLSATASAAFPLFFFLAIHLIFCEHYVEKGFEAKQTMTKYKHITYQTYITWELNHRYYELARNHISIRLWPNRFQ